MGQRSLATVLFTDIVGSTEKAAELGDRVWRSLLRRHHVIIRAEIRRFGGREVSTAGDGFLATFPRPAQAILCACAARDAVRALGLEIRSGMHVGEVEWEEENIGGIAVHIGARIAARAGAGEVLVSGTVRELEAGSGFAFEDRGTHSLKGVPGEWRVFAVTSCPVGGEIHHGSVWRRALARGPAMLTGVAAFVILFVLAGLYVGLRDGGDDRRARADEQSADVPPVQGAATPARGGLPPRPGEGVPSVPGAVGGAAADVGTAVAPGLPTDEDLVSEEGLDRAAREAKAAEAGEAQRPPDQAGLGAAAEEGAPPERLAYESALQRLPAARNAAVAARAVRFAPQLLARGDSLRTAAMEGAAEQRFSEGSRGLAEARRSYERAAAESRAKGRIESARAEIAALRPKADRGSEAYSAATTAERRAADAERAGRYEEAANRFSQAVQRYRAAAERPSLDVAAASLPSGGGGEVSGGGAISPVPARPPEEGPQPAAGAPGAPPVEAPETPPSAGARPAVERPEPPDPRQVVERALVELGRALETENLPALRRIWVSLKPGDQTNFEEWFGLMREIRVSYDLQGVETRGDAIVARVETTYRTVDDASGEKDTQRFQQVLELENRDGRWVIVGTPP